MKYAANKIHGKTRITWLKSPDRLSESEGEKLHSIKELDTNIGKAYQLMLALQRLWMVKDIDIARNYFQKWYYWATHSNIKEIAKLAKMVDRHRHGILEAMRSDLNNGVVEGLNNKIKTGFKRLMGLRRRKYRNTMIYLITGKLSISTGC